MQANFTLALEKRMQWLRWAKEKGPSIWRKIDQAAAERRHKEATKEPDFTEALPMYLHTLHHGGTYFMNRQFGALVSAARESIPGDIAFDETWLQSDNGWLYLEEPFQTTNLMTTKEAEIAADTWNEWCEVVAKRQPEMRKEFSILKEEVAGMMGNFDSETVEKARGKLAKLNAENQIHQESLNELNQFLSDVKSSLKVAAVGWFKGPFQNNLGGTQFLCFQDFQETNPNATGFGCGAYFRLQTGDKLQDRTETFEKNAGLRGKEGSYFKSKENELAWVYTAFYLMAQKLTHHSEQTNRNVRRRAEAEHYPVQPIVKVISLRRLEEDRKKDPKGKAVDWQCQWTVRQHWRNQYYPATGEHKPKLIAEYLKGPEDKPIKPPSHRIFVAMR